jgi:hypothetical protein
MHAIALTLLLVAQVRSKDDPLVVGKASIINRFTCISCGATIQHFPACVDVEDLRSLDGSCRVHLQSSRWMSGQETGKLDKTEFVWIGQDYRLGPTVVDVRTIIKANDPNVHNKTELVQVFILAYSVYKNMGYYPLDPRDAASGKRPRPKPQAVVQSDFVGRLVWVESQFLTQISQAKGFEVKGDEVSFEQTHFHRQKIQNFWAEFCERFSEDDAKRDPRLGAKVRADYQVGVNRLQQRTLAMTTNNAARYRKTATERLLTSLATKYNLKVEHIQRMVERKVTGNNPRNIELAERQEYWQNVEETLAGVCERHGISLKIGWIIFASPTELGLKTLKPEHQEAIDNLRILSFVKK